MQSLQFFNNFFKILTKAIKTHVVIVDLFCLGKEVYKTKCFSQDSVLTCSSVDETLAIYSVDLYIYNKFDTSGTTCDSKLSPVCAVEEQDLNKWQLPCFGKKSCDVKIPSLDHMKKHCKTASMGVIKVKYFCIKGNSYLYYVKLCDMSELFVIFYRTIA